MAPVPPIDTPLEPSVPTPGLIFAVSKLPKKQRLVVMIRISEMLPFKDIGNILHMSEGTAKVNFHHGMKRIKTLLGIIE